MLDFTRDEIFSSPLIRNYFNTRSLERFWTEHQLRQHNPSHLFWTLLNLSLWNRLLLSGQQHEIRDVPPPASKDAVSVAA
jgi:hypothetical protein